VRLLQEDRLVVDPFQSEDFKARWPIHTVSRDQTLRAPRLVADHVHDRIDQQRIVVTVNFATVRTAGYGFADKVDDGIAGFQTALVKILTGARVDAVPRMPWLQRFPGVDALLLVGAIGSPPARISELSVGRSFERITSWRLSC
jgi:hypothetical protein